jgi:hypothetical protein
MIRLATKDERKDFFALYFAQPNELALTPKCDQENVVGSLVHELVHWAQSLGMTAHEIMIEDAVYNANEKRFGEDWADISIIERMADWIEDECLGEDQDGKTQDEIPRARS